jgi:hypothetical protein
LRRSRKFVCERGLQLAATANANGSSMPAVFIRSKNIILPSIAAQLRIDYAPRWTTKQ